MDKWNGKNKAFTLSYDDGVEADKRLVEIFNKYGLKCTFNLNSGILGTDESWECNGLTIKRLGYEGITDLYKGHEIAVHGRKHLAPPALNDKELEEEFLLDRDKLSQVFNTQMQGMAYAYGAYNDKVVEYLKSIGLKYARTVEDSMSFDLQEDLMRFKPTCHHANERVFELIDEFLASDDEKPKLFYLWGHAYEFDTRDGWDLIERICERISGKSDVFYGTNREVLL